MDLAIWCLTIFGASLVFSVLFLPGRLLNPLVLFSFSFAATVVAYEIIFAAGIPGLSIPVAPDTETLLIQGIGAFAGGCVLARSLVGPVRTRKWQAFPSTAQLNVLLWMTAVEATIFVICFLYLFVTAAHRYGTVIGLPAAVRADTGEGIKIISPLTVIPLQTGPIALMNLGILLAFSRRWPLKALTGGLLITAFLLGSINGSRGTFGNTVLPFMFCLIPAFHWSGVEFRFKHYLLLAGVGILVVCIMTVTVFWRRYNPGAFSDDLINNNGFYLAGNVISFDEFLNAPLPSIYPGFFTLGPIYRLANVVDQMILATPLFSHDLLVSTSSRIPGWNSNLAFAYWYFDFGRHGMLLVSFLIGMSSMSIYLVTCRKFSILRIQILAEVLMNVAMLFRTGFFDNPEYYEVIALIVVQAAWLQLAANSRLKQPARMVGLVRYEDPLDDRSGTI